MFTVSHEESLGPNGQVWTLISTGASDGEQATPIGYPGGEIDVSELAQCLSLLLEVGYLNRQSRGSLVLEMQPWPNRTVEHSIEDGIEKLQQAWQRV